MLFRMQVSALVDYLLLTIYYMFLNNVIAVIVEWQLIRNALYSSLLSNEI